MELNRFFIAFGARIATECPPQRYGQFLFNSLQDARPDLANQIRGGPLDTFHNDAKIDALCKWIEENWNSQDTLLPEFRRAFDLRNPKHVDAQEEGWV